MKKLHFTIPSRVFNNKMSITYYWFLHYRWYTNIHCLFLCYWHRLSLIEQYYTYDHYCVTTKNKYFMYKIQDLRVLYYNTAHPIKGWHSHVENTCIIFLRGEVWAHKTSLTCHFLLKCLYQARKVNSYVCGTMYQIFLCFYGYFIGFWNYSDRVVFFVFHFMTNLIKYT